MYASRATVGPVDLAFTDRFGGASVAPYDELNLALEGGDDPAVCAANLLTVTGDFAPGAQVRDMRQVHGRRVATVGRSGADADDRPEADGLVSAEPGVVLVVRVADCVPVLLADPAAGVIGAVHAGRPGVAAGVVGEAVGQMRELGAAQISAWIGPHVCGRCYEVPEQMRSEVAAIVPEAAATTSWGTPALDLGAGVRAQLADSDVVEIHDLAVCTRETPELYSFRRDGAAAGRLAGLITRRQETP